MVLFGDNRNSARDYQQYEYSINEKAPLHVTSLTDSHAYGAERRENEKTIVLIIDFTKKKDLTENYKI